ncbi:hypothetical protein Cgig2_032486 [Carnegiea gigantea]|uniref:Protein kinase domain-containing protein n=1 Tax=Carnegiea gigantea TaxID=171969 RepID=A0A9Q1KY00_9CARY|nr:hypothetical protein Cgig2_032486 [Carnegiea gigantea]
MYAKISEIHTTVVCWNNDGQSHCSIIDFLASNGDFGSISNRNFDHVEKQHLQPSLRRKESGLSFLILRRLRTPAELHRQRRNGIQRRKEPIGESENFLPNLSYKRLLKATDGFSSENLIGKGSSGVVYKGTLDEDQTIPSTHGDVYSFGILVLESFTRKKPTDGMFTDCMSLPSFVQAAWPERVMEILDPALEEDIIGEEMNTEDHTHHLIRIDKSKCLTLHFPAQLSCPKHVWICALLLQSYLQLETSSLLV